MTPEAVDIWIDEIKRRMEVLSIGSVGDTDRPRQAITNLAEARRGGMDIPGTLMGITELCSIQNRMRSQPSVVSALKAWHSFATEALGYDPERTLPPSSENDVRAWMPIFKHPGTACNYVGSVKYVCLIKQLNFDWHGPLFSSVLRGNKKLYLSRLAGTLSQKCLLTDLMMEQFVMVADAMHRPDFAVFILMSWGFLC